METDKAEGRLSRCTTASKAADGRGLQSRQGNHDTLLAQNGFYATLYNSQFDQG